MGAVRRSECGLKENKRTSHLWVVPTAGGPARQLRATPAGESVGHWSPDGKSYLYVSLAEGGSQVWVSGFDSASGTPSGTPMKITNISTEADGAIWSPDEGHWVLKPQNGELWYKTVNGVGGFVFEKK